ncbi:MAG: VWA domain-containing protein [Granulosicoccus sp.]
MIESGLQWLRPVWLWGFIPWLFVLGLWLRRRNIKSAWESVVDPQLQPYVIDGIAAESRRSSLALFAGWAVVLTLLAGPVWEQQEVPVFQAQQAEIVLFDLSRSMLSDDLPPNRLTRARFKLTDLLSQSEGRQIGLIGFAERPYVISPLTEDTGTIQAFVPSLSPDIMPVQGSRLDLAIGRAVTLFEQTGVQQGHILYIGDQTVDERDIEAARRARELGHRLSVLAVGTLSGKPLRDEQGQFLQDANGSIVVPQVDMLLMKDLANAGAGRAVRLTTNKADLERLAGVRKAIAVEADDPFEAARKTYWIEYSPWLVWPLMICALWLFRRGVVA